MPLLPVLCVLFSCLSLWSWCCAVVVYLFYFQWSILLTGHLQLGLYSLVCIWLGCQILGILVWTIEILIRSDIDFSQRFVQVSVSTVNFHPSRKYSNFCQPYVTARHSFSMLEYLDSVGMRHLDTIPTIFSSPLSLICLIHASTPRLLTSHWNIVVVLGRSMR